VNGSAFSDPSQGFLLWEQVWRPARPLLVLFAALAVSLCWYEYGWQSPVPVISIGMCLLLLATGLVIRVTVRAHPKRGPISCELELVGLVLLVVNGLAFLLLGLASLTTHASDATTTYFVGVLAGAAVGYFSKEIFTPTESDSWFAAHFRHTMNTLFQPYFYRRFNASWVGDTQARWAPSGAESDALAANDYDDQDGSVRGWGAKARRQRAKTLERGLANEPWQPTTTS
jgi:hypothetical protein